MLKALLPILSGICCLLYIYGWIEDLRYPAYVPLVWCAAVFVNDLYNWLESRDDRTIT